MFDILTNILALLFVLGVMIFVHEFGHFATAKYFGVRVDVFASALAPDCLVFAEVTLITVSALFHSVVT